MQNYRFYRLFIANLHAYLAVLFNNLRSAFFLELRSAFEKPMHVSSIFLTNLLES